VREDTHGANEKEGCASLLYPKGKSEAMAYRKQKGPIVPRREKSDNVVYLSSGEGKSVLLSHKKKKSDRQKLPRGDEKRRRVSQKENDF